MRARRIGFMVATAVAGTTVLTSGAAAQESAVGAVSKQQPVSVRQAAPQVESARVVECKRDRFCSTTGYYYKGAQTSLKAPLKCLAVGAYIRNNDYHSFRNRTKYKWRFYTDRYKLLFTVPKRGTKGAFQPKNDKIRKATYMCTGTM